ncbi:non-hydrolyzing UDP-N-acetylglucosamine 2-epimerase [Microvirga rosea]|uniref:non-hydrolyzing UDP-N-acetylglucosamine 2-epimerase n=1 Tax=Microvirga rosea TaxID=2715425 RepID=UPI001D0B71C7|nr:UDP-N-acetylglucosamine 2-epimerase (non-hydrolyzing) [Microvirga rosea]MCB8822796.1 UDP-N-acetylglucosamine 2-epimerase (non-hydrolyzing) [Microvirga rosea]
MKVLSIFGTRPEAIKMAPLVKALEAEPDLTSIVCVTGQHRAMLDQVLRLFDIRPEHDLDVMVPNQTLNGLSARMLGTLDDLLTAVKPDRVLVHGDTTTAMAASLAAFHRRIPVGHVEAGLRTYDINQPWPEELNRRIVDVASDLLFAPTARARANLESERLGGRVVVTGNTVIDALRLTVERLGSDLELQADLGARFSQLRSDRKLLLVTGHRRENFGAGFANICSALSTLSLKDDLEIVYPIHLNPNVRGPVREALADRPNIHLVEPQDYVPFVYLMQRAHLILTDSGGVQEEAPSLGKPVLVMRDVTERPEAVDAGAVRLVGTDPDRIVGEVAALLEAQSVSSTFAPHRNPYGDGHAAARIVSALTGRSFEEFAPKNVHRSTLAAE